ncbi:hypothetical protein AB4125_03915, partial [Vibrio splendidus]
MHIYKLSFIVVMLQEDGLTRGEEQDEVIESLNGKEQGSLETTRYVGQVSDLTVNSKRPCCIKLGFLRCRYRYRY